MASILTRFHNIVGTIRCQTGLRIGGSTETRGIEDVENPIVHHPITREPYIPGSSLKGKVRSLLEYRHGRRDRRGLPKGQAQRDEGEPCECAQCSICRVFGPHKNSNHVLGPTRALFRDALLSEESRRWFSQSQIAQGTGYTEMKVENMIKRTIGVADHPRTQERVPAGTLFDFEITMRIFDDDDADTMIALIQEGLGLLQQDYLGAAGSRGYGKVLVEYRIV